MDVIHGIGLARYLCSYILQVRIMSTGTIQVSGDRHAMAQKSGWLALIWVSGLNATDKTPMYEMPLTFVLRVWWVEVLGLGEHFLYLGFGRWLSSRDPWYVALALHDKATSRARITKQAQLSGPSLEPTSNLKRLSVSCPQINPKLSFEICWFLSAKFSSCQGYKN